MQGNIIKTKQLLDLGVPISTKTPEGDTALTLALRREDEKMVKILREGGATLEDALTDMIHKRDKEMAMRLLQMGAVATVDHFCSAAVNGLTTLVPEFMQRNTAFLDAKNKCGESAVFVAAKWGKVETLRELLKFGAKFDVPMADDVTPLAAAVSYGNAEVVTELLKRGANPFRKNAKGTTPLEVAVKEKGMEVVTAFMKHREDIAAEALALAIKFKGAEEIKKLLVGANPEARTSSGHSLLYLAAEKGNSIVVTELVNLGAAVNAAGEAVNAAGAGTGRCPVYAAALNGKHEALRTLLKLGATVDADSGPLYIASYHGHLGAVQVLLQHGAQVDAMEGGKTPLYAAAAQGHTLVVAELLKYRPQIDHALQVAAEKGHNQIVGMLGKRDDKCNKL
jgi:ankyrin repeat protein